MGSSTTDRTGPRSRRRRFRALIRVAGLNPYVEVPEEISRELAPWSRAGRIAVEGELEGVAIRATLVPIGRGRHRLFVNGGMRSAAGVGPGDEVDVTLHAAAPEAIPPPQDVAAALDGEPGARSAFERMTPSYCRELIRYVDDARTPGTRARRIARLVDQALARPAPGGRGNRSRPLWMCRKCSRSFVNRNQYHSCRKSDLADPFEGKPDFIRGLFDRLRATVEACGPVEVVPYRDKVAFMVRVRFAAAIPRRGWLDVGFWLTRRVESPRFHKIETIGPTTHVHFLRVTEPEQLDEEVVGWLHEAYAVGRQEHLAR